MTSLQAIVLGILQGVAEFLPISSSGHLALAQKLFGLDEVPLLFDVFLHLATLLAVVIYFWSKIWALLKAFFRWIFRKPEPNNLDSSNQLVGTDAAARKTIIAIIITTFITGVIGIVTSKLIPEMGVKVICCGFLVTSALLIVSSYLSNRHERKSENLDNKNITPKGISVLQAVLIGLMQGVGTLPGISRSGSTISGALFTGVDQKSAGDYSFIVSIPAILGAFILELKDLDEVAGTIGFVPVLAGCIAAFIVGYLSLAFLMRIIRKGKLAYFACYLIPVAILGILFL